MALYIDTDYLDTYATERGITLDGDTDAQQAAIVVAVTNFIDLFYDFKGESEQDDYVLPTDEVSITDRIKRATAEAAIMHLNDELLLTTDDGQGNIIAEDSSIGTLSESIQYEEGTRRTYKRATPVIDALLKPYLVAGGGMEIKRW